MPRELHIEPTQMTLFPTKDSLVDALTDIEELVGPELAKRLFPLLMAYHNTLLNELADAVVEAQEASQSNHTSVKE